MTSQPFELSIDVAPDDVEELDHVNNVVYLRWVQNAAAAHWRALAPADDLAAIAWVVLRHEIDYKKPARAGDALIARTWVGPATRLSYERHTQILRASDRELLAQARTMWCPVSVATGRPTQISDAARAIFSAAEH